MRFALNAKLVNFRKEIRKNTESFHLRIQKANFGMYYLYIGQYQLKPKGGGKK